MDKFIRNICDFINAFKVQGSTTSQCTEYRTVTFSPKNDPSKTVYPKNHIKSHKYTLWNFLPKNLFEQFRRIANFYFLVTSIISASIVSPISPVTCSFPLSLVIIMTACKQGYEDYFRYRADQRVNRRLVTVIRNKCTHEIHCDQIVVGDFVKIFREEDVPCDLVLLFNSDESEECYVTTSNLDGETNLKTLTIPKAVSKMTQSQIVCMEGSVICEQPSSDLYNFYGKIEIRTNDETFKSYLTIDNVLLRGSRLKDTDYVIGCVIFTGGDTKLSLNSKIVSNKFSTVEKSINRYLIIFMVLLIFEVIISTIFKFIFSVRISWDQFIGKQGNVTAYSFITDVMSFALLYSYIIPISLYVTIELQKFLGSLFFTWDIDIYDKSSNVAALSNTSDLNEELGQVQYLFSDKTGTLTENRMIFRRCSIKGKHYMEKDCDGHLYELPKNGDETAAVMLKNWPSEIWHFMISISLCHSVQIAPPSTRATIAARRSEFRESFRLKKIMKIDSTLLMDPDLPEYQSASADEKALVEASARCGIIFEKSTNTHMEIKIKKTQLIFEKLDVLEFTSERKRMSVILKDESDDLWLYCKGADVAILPLIKTGNITNAIKDVSDFSTRGFRTLVMGFKKMKLDEYNQLMEPIEQARQLIGKDRTEHIDMSYAYMENNLTLLGITAVEDRLQEDVEETLESLRLAGIKVWVLTGDKAETAENIAVLCGHFTLGTKILKIIDQKSKESCCHALKDFDLRIKRDPSKRYGMIMDGNSITIALKICPNLFKSVGMACEAVVCCRLSPLQKSEIVKSIKNSPSKPHTAAIGDGGNDVAMIQEAHVGIGIMGKEGRQATMSADFAIAKFKFLQKALLVHGHWYYMRLSTLMQYFFYKNLVFILPQFLYGFNSGFSSQELYDGMFLMCYNVLFTSLPILIYGMFEQDYNAQTLLSKPYLYKLYSQNYLLSRKQFTLWFISGIWHTCAIYSMTLFYIYNNPVNLYNSTPMEHWAFSTTIFHIVTLVVNLQILLHSSYWTVPFVLSVVLSEVAFFLFTYIYSSLNIQSNNMLTVFHMLVKSPSFWLLTLIVVVICLIPDYLILTYKTYRPNRFLPKKNEEIEIEVSTVSENSTENFPLSLRERIFGYSPNRQMFI